MPASASLGALRRVQRPLPRRRRQQLSALEIGTQAPADIVTCATRAPSLLFPSDNSDRLCRSPQTIPPISLTPPTRPSKRDREVLNITLQPLQSRRVHASLLLLSLCFPFVNTVVAQLSRFSVRDQSPYLAKRPSYALSHDVTTEASAGLSL